MNMNKRLPNSRIQNDSGFSNQPRKNKKRSNKKRTSTNESWYNNDRDRDSHEPSEDEVPGMEYTSMFWQQPRLPPAQPHPAHNGQRLFTAMSDPSVCGYSAIPVTYAMEPVSLPPMYRLYQPVVRPNYRTYHGKTRPSYMRKQNGPPCGNDSSGNGYSSLQENGWCHSTPMAYQNGDYASLPPTANIDNKNDIDELSSEHRRYSDPGLGPAELPPNAKSEDSDSAESGSSITTVEKGNKIFVTFIQQMTKMKETNNELFKELHQAKSELEFIKTELNQFKQNIPLDYQPGMLSEIIKEIRDASKIKEEAMLSKMKLLMEGQQSQKSNDLEQLKNQLEKANEYKEESEERIAKLEREVASLRVCLNSENREIAAFEEENLTLRRELQEARASRNLAESHACKCVNAALARAITPVNFESPYSPCITSTPVRTTFESTSTDPSSSVGSFRSTGANHDSLPSSPGSSSLSPPPPSSSELSSESKTILAVGSVECHSNSSSSSPSSLERNHCSESACYSQSAESQEPGSVADKPDCALAPNSVVSEDLCSTNILTSRVLTAPSRATYTTAYI